MRMTRALVYLSLLEQALPFSPIASWTPVRSLRGETITFGKGHSSVRTITFPRVALQSSASAISSNEELLPGIDAIDTNNEEVFNCLEAMREAPYFRFFSVDILASCEYIPQELFECYTEGCEILPIDEEKVRYETLS